ncbi:MAG: DUF342 domain-containing protein [Planctomycetota bacterium]
MTSPARTPAVDVTIDDGGAVAKVVITANADSDDVDAASIADLARERGVAVDSDVEARLGRIVENFRAKPRPMAAIIARAKEPVNGDDGELIWAEGCDPGAADQADGSDTVDYYRRVTYVHVVQGTEVATLREPTEGTDGCDVTGRAIKARPGKPFPVTVDPSLTLAQDGRIIAERDGVLQHEDGVIQVSRLFDVSQSINFTTGNVDFDGSVHVREDVCDRFEVKATEDIVVDGLIEAATIRCAGNLTCRGMAGRDKGRLMVGGDVDAGYLNGVHGHIDGSLMIRREMINCDLVVRGDLISDQGSVMGGEVAVGGSVSVANLGAEAGTPTTLYLREATLLDVKILKLGQLREQLEAELEEAAASSLRCLRADIVEIEKAIEVCKASRGALGSPKVAPLRVHKEIHVGVSLKINGVSVTFDRPLQGPMTIDTDARHQLQFRPGDGPARPLDTVARIARTAA